MRAAENGASQRWNTIEAAGDKPGKALRQLSQAVQGVEVRALPVAGQRFTVQLDAIDGLQAGNIKIAAGKQTRVHDFNPPHDRTSPGAPSVTGEILKVPPSPLQSDFTITSVSYMSNNCTAL